MIRIESLYKSFKEAQILTDLTFSLEAGDRLALLGANGCGKTLLLKIIATLIKPTSGSVEIAGYDALARPRDVRPLIGYVPEIFDPYPDLSVQEYLEFFAAAYRLERAERATMINDVLELMDLATLREGRTEQLSSGQKRRLCLAKTFLHDPLIWLLDGSIEALDPRGQTEMKALILELGAMGKTVIWATNRLTDVETTCSHVGVLDKGNFVLYGDMNGISKQFETKHRLEIEVTSGIDTAQSLLEARSGVIAFEVADSRIQIESEMTNTEIAELLRDLIHAGVGVLRYEKSEAWLANLFLDLTNSVIADEE